MPRERGNCQKHLRSNILKLQILLWGSTRPVWVKWTMTLVKLEGPLETDTWLLNESCSGLAWPPSPRTHFSSQILENRQRKTGNSQTQPLALTTKCKIFFFLSHFLRDRVFFKDSLNISRKPLTFFCFGKESSPPPPAPSGSGL